MKVPLWNHGWLLALAASISACQDPLTVTQPVPVAEPTASGVVAEVGRLQWQIGDLEVETVLMLEDGVPAHQTTVTNSNETDRWWTGLRVYGHSISGSSGDPDSLGGWGGAGGQACTDSKTLPEIGKGTVRMKPGETRSYHDVYPGYPTSPQRETVTRWALKGKMALPSAQPFPEWPPFELRFSLKWSRDQGCSVETKPID